MDDADKIREAWSRRHCKFDISDGRRVVIPVPICLDAPIRFRDEDWNTMEPVLASDQVEFRLERGLQDGKPSQRIVGSLRDTEVVVELTWLRP